MIRPPSAASRPAISRSVDDLPHPDGPRSTLSVPSSNANVTRSTARTSPSAVAQCLLRFSARMADTNARDRWRLGEQRGQGGARIGGTHERLADEKRVHAVPTHLRYVALRDDATFGDDDAIGWNARQEPDRRVQRHVERTQVAVVDADQWRRELERAVELGGVVHLDQHVHAAGHG